MKVTQWFCKNDKPVHVGVYQRQDHAPDRIVYGYWDGLRWGFMGVTPRAAHRFRAKASYSQELPWRGLAEKPEAA